MNSSTSLMYQGIGRTVNVVGGFFRKWKGKGSVIDPDLNFVQNLNRHNLSVLNIELAIVTHNHDDTKVEENLKLRRIILMLREKELEIRWYSLENQQIFEDRVILRSFLN